MRSKLLSLLLLLLPVAVWANGDPVIRFSSVTKSGNPIPLQVSEVRIVHEQLTFRPGIPYSTVEVKYTLQNRSDKAIKDLDYGFPVDFEGSFGRPVFEEDGISESLYERGWKDDYVREVAFLLDGKPLEWHKADEILEKERQVLAFEEEDDWFVTIPQQSRLWTYTRFDIAPRATVVLEVRYSFYHSQAISPYQFGSSPLSRYFTDRGTITYDMTPAKHWGDGKAGSIDIVLDASNLPAGSEYRIKGLDFTVKDWKWTFHADAFDFAKAPEIRINFWPPRPKKDGEPYPSWVDIDTFLLPASAYRMTQTENTIDLDFPTPVAVTDISFFNGNYKDAKAWEREARAEEVQVEILRADGHREFRPFWKTTALLSGDFYKLEYYEYAPYQKEAFGLRKYMCLTNVQEMDGNRLLPNGPDEWKYDPGHDNRIKHIRITVLKLTPGKPTGQNPLSGIKVYVDAGDKVK